MELKLITLISVVVPCVVIHYSVKATYAQLVMISIKEKDNALQVTITMKEMSLKVKLMQILLNKFWELLA